MQKKIREFTPYKFIINNYNQLPKMQIHNHLIKKNIFFKIPKAHLIQLILYFHDKGDLAIETQILDTL